MDECSWDKTPGVFIPISIPNFIVLLAWVTPKEIEQYYSKNSHVSSTIDMDRKSLAEDPPAFWIYERRAPSTMQSVEDPGSDLCGQGATCKVDL